MKISVFGAGYVGLVTGACLANMGHEVLVMDIDESKIENLKKGEVHIYEPGLLELTTRCVQRNKLHFTTNTADAVKSSEVLLICVDTPSSSSGSANLSSIWAVARSIGEHLDGYKVVVNRSTVPPGTAKKVHVIISENAHPNAEFDVVSNPEFLREGLAIRAFNYPDKIVVGAQADRAFQMVKKMYSGRMRTYLPLVETDWETAEVVKYANNAFLASKISFINEMANICDIMEADVKMVSLALGLDFRISPRFLNPGVGYGGSCFPKDIKAIIAAAQQKGYDAHLFKAVHELNERQKGVILEKINRTYQDNLQGKVFSILGLSFKPLTSDMREAPSIHVVKELLAKGARLKVHDPRALEEAKKIFGNTVSYHSSHEDVVKDSHAIVLLTEWDEFRNLDFEKLGKMMVEKTVFDGRNIYEPEILREHGFEYYGMGRK